MAEEIERGPRPENEVSGRVYDLIGDLGKRQVLPRDRGDLRKALDKADADPVGRERSDAALGNLSRRG